MKMKSHIKDNVQEVKMEDLILKKHCFTAIVLVSLILNNQNGTKDNAIYKQTLNICEIRKGDLAKQTERCVLYINDFVAAEARYHVTYRKNFENHFSVSTPGRPSNLIN